ncbi:MAG: HD domain-containing protein [Flavobacteriales bacterium]|nr:HD domain-containing protein [Flavobacteriales bacterium]
MDAPAAKAYILARLRNELPEARTYHSLEHTLDVYASAIGIAEAEGITGEGLVLLKIAALYHDAGFTVQDTDHEEAGCTIAREMLPTFGFDVRQVDLICDMIMATRIPQRPRNKLARVLCDADLDYLGRGDFDRIGAALFQEMRTYGVLRTEREWNELQLRFLERHAYFTPTNKRLREPVKKEHLDRVKKWLSANPVDSGQ